MAYQDDYSASFDRQLNNALDLGQRKARLLAEKSQQKKNEQNQLNPNNIRRVDGDTFEIISTGERIRTADMRDNTSINTYETNPDLYLKDPQKFKADARNYAYAYGMDPEDVSVDDLTNKGKLQGDRAFNRILEKAQNGTLLIERTGRDVHNRTLAQFTDTETGKSAFEDFAGMDENASYDSKYNAEQRLRDIFSGQTGEHLKGSGERSWREAGTDQLSGFAAGAADMAAGLAQTGAVLTGQGERTAGFFDRVREGTQGFREAVQSPEKLRGDRLASKRSEQRRAITSMQKAQYVANGDSELVGGIKASVGEYIDTAQDFWNNPGRAVDAFSESLPYMLGVGAVGSATARVATNKLRLEVFKDLAKFQKGSRTGQGALNKGVGTNTTREATEKFLASKAGQDTIRKKVAASGIATVGLTEGMTNASDVFSEVMKMTEAEANQSEAYQELRANGKTHEDALYELAQGAWAQSLVTTTILAAAAAGVTGVGSLEARMFTGIRNPSKAAAASTAKPPTIAGRYKQSPKEVRTAELKAKSGTQPNAKQIKKIRKKVEGERAGTVKSKIPGAIKAVGKSVAATGRALKTPGNAAGREFVEESLQSGGGELLGQISKQKATGQEIGPGVGEATATGGIVGFLSGGFVSGATAVAQGGAQKLLDKTRKTNLPDAKPETGYFKGGSDAPAGGVGGDANAAARQAIDDPNYNAYDETNKILDDIEKDDSPETIGKSINAAAVHYQNAFEATAAAIAEAEAAGDTKTVKDLTDKQTALQTRAEDASERYQAVVRNSIAESKPRILGGKATKADMAMLETAANIGVEIDPQILEKLGPSARSVLAQTQNINDIIGSIEDPTEAINAEIAARGLEPGSPEALELTRTMESTYRQKFGFTRYAIPGTKATDVRGVKRYLQDISAALQTGNKTHADRLIAKYKKFVAGQRAKINRLEKIKTDKPKTYYLTYDAEGNPVGQEYTYSEKGIDSLLSGLKKEQVAMEKIGDLLENKSVAYDAVLQKGIDIADSPKTAGTRLKAIIKTVKSVSITRTKEYAKEKGIDLTNAATDADIVQTVAEFIFNAENNPEGSDTPDNTTNEEGQTQLELDLVGGAVTPGRGSAEGGKGGKKKVAKKKTTRKSSSTQEPGAAKANAVYADFLKQNPKGTKKQVVSALRKGRKGLSGAELEAYNYEASQILDNFGSAVVQEAPDNFNTAFSEVRNDYKNTMRQAAAETDPQAQSLLYEQAQALRTQAEQLANDNLQYPSQRIRKMKTLDTNVGPGPLAQINLDQATGNTEAQQARRKVQSTQEALRKNKRNFQRKFKSQFPTAASVQELIDDPGPLTAYPAEVRKDLRDLWAADDANEAAMADYVNARLNRTKEEAAELDQKTKDIADFRKLSPTDRIEKAFSLGLDVTAFEASKKGLSTLTKKVVDKQAELRSNTPLAQTQLETDPDKVSGDQPGPIGLNNNLYAMRRYTREKLKKLIAYLKSLETDSPRIRRELFSAEALLNELDNPSNTHKDQQKLVSAIHEATEKRLRSESFQYIIDQSPAYQQALLALAEIGSDGNITEAMRQARDTLLEELLDTIEQHEEDGVDPSFTDREVLQTVYKFMRDNPDAWQNAFLAGGVRLSDYNEWLSPTIGGKKISVIESTANANLPTKLSDSFGKATDKDLGFLTKYPNWMTKLRLDYNAMDIEANTQLYFAVGAFHEFHDQFRTTLLNSVIEWGPDSKSQDSIFYKNGINIGSGNRDSNKLLEDPAWFLRDAYGNVNENLITAMALEAFQYTTGAGQRTLFNTPVEVSNILGLPNNSLPTDEQMAVLGTVGDGIENVYDLIGNKLMQHVNIKGIGLSTGELRTVLPRALASRTVTTMGEMQVVSISPVDLNQFNPDATEPNERKFVRLAVNDGLEFNADEFIPEIKTLTRHGIVLKESGHLEEMFGAVAKSEHPSFEPFETVEKKVRGTVMFAPMKTQKASQADQDKPLVRNKTMIAHMKLFPNPQLYMQAMHNYQPTIEGVHVTKHDNIRGRNGNFVRDYENSFRWIARMEETGNEEFYVPNRNITNLRTMVVNTYVNTQASKLHRPMFPKAEAMTVVPVSMTPASAKGNAEMTGFYRSVVQKLGGKLLVSDSSSDTKRKVKVEYLSDEVMLNNVQDLIDQWQYLIDHLKNPDGDIDGEAVLSATQAQDFIDAKIYNEENGETFATLSNLASLQAAQEAGGNTVTLKLYQPVQTDATTSGFANSLMQLATAKDMPRIKAALRRVGASFREDPNTATQYMQANPDSYEIISDKIAQVVGFMTQGYGVTRSESTGELTEGRSLQNELEAKRNRLIKIESGGQRFMSDPEIAAELDGLREAVRILSVQANPDLIAFTAASLGFDVNGKPAGVIPELVGTDGKVTGPGRNLAKPPFMLGNYAAGRASAKLALASDSYSTLLDLMSSINDPAQLAEVLTTILEAAKAMGEIQALVSDSRRVVIRDVKTTVEEMIKITQGRREQRWAIERERYGELTPMNLGSLVVFPIELTRAIQQIYHDTYGEALQVALDSELNYLAPARDGMHRMAYIANAIFQPLLDNRVKEFVKNQNGIFPDVTQMKHIIDNMVNEGLFPGISSADSAEMNDKIEAVKRESIALYIGTKRIQGKLGFEQAEPFLTDIEGYRRTQKTMSFTVQGYGFKDDPGVAPTVRVIQSIEAVIQSGLLQKYAITNTYDGQGARGDTAREIGISANESVVRNNHDYNMFDAAHDMMSSMLRVMHPSSQQLTSRQKENIMELVGKKARKTGEPEAMFNSVLNDLSNLQNEIHRGRDEIWRDMLSLNNYMESPASEIYIEQVLGLPKSERTVFQKSATTITELSEAFDQRIYNQEEHNKAWMIQLLNTRMSEGLAAISNTFKQYIRAEANKTMGVGYFMDLLNQSLTQTEGNAQLTGVVEQLYPYLKGSGRDVKNIRGVRIVLSKQPLKDAKGEPADGLYYPGQNPHIKIYSGAKNFIPTVLHEVFHVVTGEYINQAELNAPENFKLLVEQAKSAAKAMVENTDKGMKAEVNRLVGAQLEFYLAQGTLQDTKNAVSELISYVTTTVIDENTTGELQFAFLEQYNSVLNSLARLKEMAAVTEEPSNRQAQGSAIAQATMGIPIINEGSSSEDIDTVEFLQRTVKSLPGQQIGAVLNEIDQLETGTLSRQHNETLNTVIQKFIMPSLATVDNLTVKISTKPGSIKNLGGVEVLRNDEGKVLGQTMYLEAAGNELTSNIDLSLKETTVHEYLHPVVRWALENDWKTHGQLKKLFEAAREAVSPLDFMPRNPTGDIVYAQQQAQERYDYIFNNPKGDMSEFLINGVVNEQLIDILAEKAAPNTDQSIVGSTPYETLSNIIGKLMRFFTRSVNKSKSGKIGPELQVLLGNIVAINMQQIGEGVHRTRSTPRMDSANGWLTNKIGEKIADPLRKFVDNNMPEPGQSRIKDAGFTTLNALLEASNEDFQQSLNEFFRSMKGEKDNHLGEMAAELVPSQKGQMIYKEMFRRSHHVIDRARRSEIEHMQKLLRAHFDPDKRYKHRRADKQALTHIGMRADLSALLGPNNNFERLQAVINSTQALDSEIAARTRELSQVTNGDTALFNVLHNQTLGLAELNMLGQTFRANTQQNPYSIANQHFFSDVNNRRPLADVARTEGIIDELKTLHSLRIANEQTPQLMDNMRNIVNHEMSRPVDINGFQMFMNMHAQFKEASHERLFRGNPQQMRSGYVYEQYNPDIDMQFTPEDVQQIRKMEEAGYKRIGMMPRDPRDPQRTPMIMWKGLNGKAMYMKGIVSTTDISARGADVITNLRRPNTMTMAGSATQAKYNIIKLKQKMEADVLAQMSDPNVQSDQARAIPVYDEDGNLTNYRYMMTQASKETILEANQAYDYLLGRMFGSIVDKEASLDINSKTAKLLHTEYVEGQKNKALRFVEVGENASTKEAREMWRLLPKPMQEELNSLFGGNKMYIRDDVIKMTLGFRKATIGNAKWLGKSAFAARAAERVWFDVIRLLKMKIVLTMPDVVIGNMASNIAYLMGDGIPLDFIAKEIKNGLQGINAWQKDEEAMFRLDKAMAVSIRTNGRATKQQITDKAILTRKMANNPIATLAQEGVFTGIADELEPDAWNYRNKVMQWAAEKTDSWVPASVVSATKEVMVIPGSETFKVALAATQYADFIARHVVFKYDTEVRGKPKEESLQRAIDTFIYYDIPQNVWLQYANDLGVLMFTKYFFRIQQQIYKQYKNTPLTALSVLGIQKSITNFPMNSNIGDYALLDNFNFQSRFHMMPWKTMDSADLGTPALWGALAYPFAN